LSENLISEKNSSLVENLPNFYKTPFYLEKKIQKSGSKEGTAEPIFLLL